MGQNATSVPRPLGRFEAAIAAADKASIPRSFQIFVTEWGFEYKSSPTYPSVSESLDWYNQQAARFQQLKFVAAWTLQAGYSPVDEQVITWVQYPIDRQFDPGQQPAKTHDLFGATLPSINPPPPPTGNPTNLLRNGDFEAGWWHPGGVAELQFPIEWNIEVFTYPGISNPYDTAEHSRFVRPESRVLTRDFIPQSEWNDFFWTPESLQIMKLFFAASWYCRLYQELNLSGGVYQFTARGFADLVKSYNPKVWATYNPENPFDSPAGLMRVNRSDWQVWIPGKKQEVVFDIQGPITEVSVEIMCPYALANSGFFFDEWKLVKVEEPMPDTCRGTPREQYNRTVLLLPPSVTTPDWAAAVAEATMPERWTISYSADDAGIGDLDSKNVVAVNPDDWGGDLDAWFDSNYPGTGYLSIDALSPADLKAKLIALLGGTQPDNPFPHWPLTTWNITQAFGRS